MPRVRVFVASVLLIGTLLGGGMLERSYGQRPADNLRYLVVEGQRFGTLVLGMSVDEVRAQFSRTFLFATPFPFPPAQPEYLDYSWIGDSQDFTWSVIFDATTHSAKSIGYGLNLGGLRGSVDEVTARLQTARFATTKGVHYGHNALTVQAVYGMPRYFKSSDNKILGGFYYWYPRIEGVPGFGVEFEFRCWQDCESGISAGGVVSGITIHGQGWIPPLFR